MAAYGVEVHMESINIRVSLGVTQNGPLAGRGMQKRPFIQKKTLKSSLFYVSQGLVSL